MLNLLPELGKSTNDSVSLTLHHLGYDVHHALPLLEAIFLSHIIPEGSYSSGSVFKMTGEFYDMKCPFFLTWILLIKQLVVSVKVHMDKVLNWEKVASKRNLHKFAVVSTKNI